MDGYEKPTFDFFSDRDKNKRISKKQEKKIAKTRDPGRTTPGSGNGKIKGDVIKKSYRQGFKGRKYEAKTTDKDSIRVTKEWLEKLVDQASRVQQEPVFVFGFEGSTLLTTNWGAVPLDRLEELFEIERKYVEGLNE